MASSNYATALEFDLSVTIAVGQTASNAIDTYGTSIVAIITDANITATALTFLCSDSLGGTYKEYRNLSDGSTIATTALSTDGYYGTAPIDFSSARFIKIVGNTNQATTPTVITLVTRRLA